MAKADLNTANKSGSCRNGLAILCSSFDTIIAYSFQLNVTPYQKKPDISQLFVNRCVHKAGGRVTISHHVSVHPSVRMEQRDVHRTVFWLVSNMGFLPIFDDPFP